MTPSLVRYIPGFLCKAESSLLLEALRSELKWEQRDIRLFGRKVAQPRLTCWYGDKGTEYGYSGVRLEPFAWHPELQRLRTALENELQHPFNAVLANAYRNGRDSMGWHSDNEPELGADPMIASISLGENRRFLLRHRASKKITEYHLESGSLLVMQGKVQSDYQHSLPKTVREIGWRINLTYRQVFRR